MIKEQSFEWLLEGCHRIADVAVAYLRGVNHFVCKACGS